MLAAVTENTQELIANLSIDIIVIVALVAIFFFIGFRSGKTKLIGIVFSTYVAGMLLITFPFRSSITFDFGLLFAKYNVVDLGILIILIGLINIILDYVLELEFEGFSLRKTLDAIILSTSATLSFLAGIHADWVHNRQYHPCC